MSVEALFAGKFICAGNGRHVTRVINTDELIVVLQGELEMVEEDRQFRVRPGEWLLLKRGRRHGGLAPYPDNLSFFWFHFMDDGSVMETLPQHGILQEPTDFSVYAQAFLNEQSRLAPDREIMNLLLALMIQEMRRTSSIPEEQKLATPLAVAAQKFIGTHFFEDLSLETISSSLHCNAQYLSRLYHRTYGETLIEALNKVRISRAKWYLATGSLSIKEIARCCGFNDMAYFRRQFHRYCSMTPSAFRQQYLAGKWNTQ